MPDALRPSVVFRVFQKRQDRSDDPAFFVKNRFSYFFLAAFFGAAFLVAFFAGAFLVAIVFPFPIDLGFGGFPPDCRRCKKRENACIFITLSKIFLL